MSDGFTLFTAVCVVQGHLGSLICFRLLRSHQVRLVVWVVLVVQVMTSLHHSSWNQFLISTPYKSYRLVTTTSRAGPNF